MKKSINWLNVLIAVLTSLILSVVYWLMDRKN